jgi:Skp family chaperone for outer membrane proteins
MARECGHQITKPRERKEKAMSKAKLAAFFAGLFLVVGSSASAQLAKPAAARTTRANLVAWCKTHPAATADCREVRNDRKAVKADTKEVKSDRKEVRADLKAGEKREAKADARELRSDRKDLRQDKRDTRKDARDIRKDARK